MTQLDILNQPSPAADDEARFLHPGRWWHRDGGRIVCDLCPRKCVLKEGDRGFCFVRQNLGGEMMLTTYGRSTGFCVDPIEKKPLNHFLPGTSVLSFGTAGCNLGCKFCQNWDISKSREVERLSEQATPEAIARAAHELGCRSVAFTYNDPVIWAEYALETARACRAVGIKAVAVTAGYITDEARPEFYAGMDAANVDLKAFTEDFYYKLTLSHLDPVLRTLEYLKRETDVWFEITNLVIPQANDTPDEFRRLCDWVLKHVGDEVPLHFTAFHPDFRMRDRGRTPPETLNQAREIALTQGLKYVYTGNVDDATRQSTYCPGCGNAVIERNWYELGRYDLDGNRCGRCGTVIAGHFDEGGPGEWGRRRLPVDMRRFADTPRAPEAPPSMKLRPTASPQRPDEDSGMTTTSASAVAAGLTGQQGRRLVAAAARVVERLAQGRNVPADWFGEDGDGLSRMLVAGAFVSLKRDGQLRSCCGTFGQTLPLADALLNAARRAATSDPRFPPVTALELPFLDLEVWVLDHPEEVVATGECRREHVEVGRHGLQVIRGEKRGLLLPGVPVEHGWSVDEFLGRTCVKAGLPPTAWREDGVRLIRFGGRAFRGEGVFEQVAPVSAAPPLSAGENAAYGQYCRRTLTALLSGAVASYYDPRLTDLNAHGLALFVGTEGNGREVTVSRINARQTVPLQATAFAFCEQLARQLSAQRVDPAGLRVDVAVFAAPALHGSLAEPDLRGVAAGERALFVQSGSEWDCAYDADRDPRELLQEMGESLGATEPVLAPVVSFAVATGRQQFHFGQRVRAESGAEVRPPAVAGRFYPGDAAGIERALDALLQGEVDRRPCSAVMVPHAGWRFSGRIAADVLRRTVIPRTVIVIGPKHTPHGVEWAVAPHASWQLPGGAVASDPELARRLAERIPGLELDAAAHRQEHGIEVELPIIHRLAPDSRVVGITIGGGSLEQLTTVADRLADVITEMDEPPLLVISSDMNHFANDAETRRLDALALAELDRLDADALFATTTEHRISMCGMRPAVIVLKALKKLGRLHRAERIAYATSGDVTGDTSRVVGYAGMLFE